MGSIFDVLDGGPVKVGAAVPRLRIEFVQILSDVINDLAGAARPVEIKLFGLDLSALETYAKRLDPKLSKVEGLEDFFNGVAEPSAEMDMTINQAESNRVGLTPSQVADAASSTLLGTPAGEIRLDDRSVAVRVRAPDSVRFDPRLLATLPIYSSQTHGSVPLGALASFQPTDTRSELRRENQQQMIAMTADLAD